MTAPSFLYYEMVKKRDLGRGGQNLGFGVTYLNDPNRMYHK